MSEAPLYLRSPGWLCTAKFLGETKKWLQVHDYFLVSHGILKGKGLQFPGRNFVDKTLKPPESTDKTTFLVLSRIRYKICTRAWSSLPLSIPWKTLNFDSFRKVLAALKDALAQQGWNVRRPFLHPAP